MNTHEPDPLRAKMQALIRTAIVGVEEKLGTSLYEHLAKNKRGPTRGERKAFRIEQPYCFTKLAGGNWLGLNRIYKPLGVSSLAWVDYEDAAYVDRAISFPLDPRAVQGVWWRQSETHLWLYSDDPRSLRTYYQRFARLAAAMCPWRLAPKIGS